jgi:Polyketide cyclase / dehydrase and lipid transport
MALHLTTKIDIEAAPEAVWSVLSDLPSYPSWNPFAAELCPASSA